MIETAIIGNFTTARSTYDSNATIQTVAASYLEELLSEISPTLPEGDVLEIGCGTGLFSTTLLSHCSDRHIVFSDASEKLLSSCRDRVGEEIRKQLGVNLKGFAPVQVSFETIDVEQLSAEPAFALVASSFMLQWISDLESCLDRLAQTLVPGGYLLFSVPSSQSFPEWKRICKLYDFEYSANALPDRASFEDTAHRLGLKSNIVTCSHTLKFNSAREFFKNLKLTGSHTKTAGSAEERSQLRQLIRAWNLDCGKQIEVTYHIVYGYLRRPW